MSELPFSYDRVTAAWADFPSLRCPICDRPVPSAITPCGVCGEWWKKYGLAYPNGPYVEAARLLPSLVPLGCVSLLAVGGGDGIPAEPAWLAMGIEITAIDINPSPQHLGTVQTLDARHALATFGPKSFDIVQACDMSEHVPKADGVQLLADFRQLARKFVAITTPNGFTHQDPENCPTEPWAWNPYQKHVCGWSPEEIEAAGYLVYINGLNKTGHFRSCYLTGLLYPDA